MKALRVSWRALTREHETSATFSVVVVCLYMVFLVWAHVHHEAWRDEIHPWIIAKRAQGFWDIATGDRIYDGHPPLWYWYLRLWTWITHRPWGLHAANIAVMGAAALLLLRFGPFARVLKLGLLASYQVTFEYGVVSRNYGLGLLLVMIFCVRFHPLRPRLIGQAAVLGLLGLSSVYGLLIAACLFLTLVPLAMRVGRAPVAPITIDLTLSPRLLGAALLLMTATAFSLYTTTPPDPNPASPGWNFAALDGPALGAAARRLIITFFPVRYFDGPRYWGNVWAFWGDHPTVLSAATVALLLLLPLSLTPPWTSPPIFLLGAGMMAIVQISRYTGGPRHWGHWLILYLALCWISRRLYPRRRHLLSSAILAVAILFQFESLLAAVGRDRVDLFSGGPEAAAFIEKHGLQDLPLVAGPEDSVTSVTGHLGRVFISAESEEVNETMVFHGRRRPFDESALVARAVEVGGARHSAVLLVSNRALPAPADPGIKFEELFRNSQDGPHGENFVIYRLWSDTWRKP
ncbi:MAG: hypothetical protein ABJA82_06895 [Myxococcales bacterium]